MPSAVETLMNKTLPAPPERRTGDYFAGTIGFDLYLALFATMDALRPPRVPKEAQ